MAVELTATDYSGTGTGAAATYGTGIYANASDQIKVYIDGALQTIGDDYSLSGIGSAGGVDVLGTFTLGSAVYVERVTPITQLVDTQNNETILEDVLDAEFDKLTMIAQELSGTITRAIVFPKGEAGLTLPDAATRAGKFIGFDAGGAPIFVPGTSTSILTTVANRAALAAVAAVAGIPVYLQEARREGFFVCKAGVPPADPQQGIYVASNTAGFYWQRVWDGVTGKPEWFGAIGIVGGLPLGATDNRTAFDACLALCPVMQLAALDYTITDVWKASLSSRTIQGTAGGGSTVGYGVDTSNRYGMAGGTRVVLVGANVVASTVFQFGKDAPSASDDINQMRNSNCRDIVFARDCYTYRPRVSLTTDPIDCVKGVLFIGASDCTMERCWSYDSPVGFHTIGVVISKLIDCSVRRVSPALTAVRDYFVGYLHGGYGAANFGYIGNSASCYFIRCHVFDEDGAFDTSWGMRLFGRFADTFVIDFEMARLNYGIEIDGRDAAGVTMSNATYQYAQQDVSIINPVIDGCSLGGIWMHNCQDYFCVDIVNPYVASGGFNIKGDSCGGSIKVTGGRMLGNGFVFNACDGVGIKGVHVRDAAAPLVMTTCGMFDIQFDAMQFDVACAQAVNMTGCFRGKLAVQLRGAPSKATYGVNCDVTTNLVEVDGSAINPGCFVAVDAANKVRYNGGDARTAFGSNVLLGVTG